MASEAEELRAKIAQTLEHVHTDLSELQRRFNRIELSLMMLQMPGNKYVGICVNAACGAPVHPHWDEEFWRTVDLSRTIAEL